MLHQRYRLLNSADIGRVRENGRSLRHPLAILLVDANDRETSRFAFLASRRVGHAVKRNRAKRLLREAVRLHVGLVAAGWDCILIARKRTATASFSEVENAVLQLLTQAGLLENRLRPMHELARERSDQ